MCTKLNNRLYNLIQLHWNEDNFDWDCPYEVSFPLIKLNVMKMKYKKIMNSTYLSDHAKIMLKRGGCKQGRRYLHEANWYF